MSCDAELDALNEVWDERNKARAEMRTVSTRLAETLEQFEHLCGYFEGDGRFVIDPLEPTDPDFPPGSPTCPEAFGQWWDAYLEFLPFHMRVKDLEAETAKRFREWADCKHREGPGGHLLI